MIRLLRQIELTPKIDFHLVGSPGEAEDHAGVEQTTQVVKREGERCGIDDADRGFLATVEVPRSASSQH